MPETLLPKISTKGFQGRVGNAAYSLLCWPMKRRAEMIGYSQKISISGWLPVSLGLLRWRLIGSKLPWATMLEFSWSDREQHLNYVVSKSNRSYPWLHSTSMC